MPNPLLENYIAKVLGKESVNVPPQGTTEGSLHERMQQQARQLTKKYGDKDYIKHHALRYAYSLDWLAQIRREHPLHVAELGGGWPFSEMYKQSFAQDRLTVISSDLRFLHEDVQAGKLTVTPGSQDLIVCMEVLEHIQDQMPAGKIVHSWGGDGAVSMMKGAWELLKPNGLLFLTTPNACSRIVMRQLFHMGAPSFFRSHVREYSPQELRRLATDTGFLLARMETVNVWDFLGVESEYRAFDEFMKKQGFPMSERGDDLMLLARKPAQKTSFKIFNQHT